MAEQLAAIFDHLRELLGNSDAGDLAVKIANAVAKLPAEETRYLSYGTLSRFGSTSSNDPHLLSAVALLTSHSADVLDVFFVYHYGGAEEKEQTLTADELAKANDVGYVVDPDSGEPDGDYKNHISPYFKATPSFISAAGKNG